MALSPNIPTSFVPKQQITPAPRHRSSGENLFMSISLVILAVSLLGAGGVFGYQQYLNSVDKDKAAEVENVQKTISTSDVEEYVRSRDRVSEAKTILDQHIATSQFLALLEKLTIQNVYFDSLHLTLNDDRSAKIVLTGTARNFNALAAQSSVFSAERELKGTVFSDITTLKNGLVSFSVTTSLDADFLVMEVPTAGAPLPSLPVATSTPLTATSTPVATSTSKSASTTPLKATPL
jgi:hypothetical protein